MPIEKVSWQAIANVLEDELFRDTGVLYNYYSTQETKLRLRSPLYLEILYQISQGNTRLSQIAKMLNREPQDINHYVRKLREMDIIDENNVIIDPLFSIWLQTAWFLTNKLPTLQIKEKYKAFQRKIGEIIETYKTYLGLTAEIIIRKLFERFDDRKISTEETLPKFDMIIPNAKINNEEIDLLCIKNKKAWAIEIKTKPLTKTHVIEFHKKHKKSPTKQQRR